MPHHPFIRSFKPSVIKAAFFGFSLIELLTVLVIAGILAALAAPAMSTFVQSNRLAATTNEFIGALNLARSEAIKRGTNAGVCKSDNGSTCTATGNWNSGWIVFIDADNTGGTAWTASDSMVKAHESVVSSTAINGSDAIVYDRVGRLFQQPAAGFSYTVCNSIIHQSRTVTVGTQGRAVLSQGTC